MDFLNSVWPLDEIPSEDRRFRTATRDIVTHMGLGDWDDTHILLERFSPNSPKEWRSKVC